jgi:hypothetical protein
MILCRYDTAQKCQSLDKDKLEKTLGVRQVQYCYYSVLLLSPLWEYDRWASSECYT